MERNRIHRLVAICLATVTIICTGCSSGKLELSSFADVVNEHSMRVQEVDSYTDSRITAWHKARSDENSTVIQFIECSSKSDANSFYQEQVDYLENNCASSTEPGSASEGRYTLTASGFYYEIDCLGTYVIYATTTSSNRSEVLTIMDELPDPAE